VRWINVWNELIGELDEESLPTFPIWADNLRGDLVVPAGTPSWKRNFLVKNHELYLRNRSVIDAWLERHDGLAALPLSRRKLEWQAQDAERDLWKHVMHFRPSGIRVKQGTYVPALVAITQTSIWGPERRRLTPREAARLQGLPDTFLLHPEDKIAYRQLGNGVNVGVVRHAVRALLADSEARERLAS
jgi:DNA (cytosine-5)-methyltransferase 1